MDREILFKAKRKDNGEWIEGYYLPIGERAYIICEAELESVDGENTDLYATEWYEVDPETVCQYTGLTDKNGRKIFEGDIVKVDDLWTGLVIWEFNDSAFQVEPNDDMEMMESLGAVVNGSEVEFIGNIYDNPELLGAGIDSGQQAINRLE